MRPGIHIARSFYDPIIEQLNLLNLLHLGTNVNRTRVLFHCFKVPEVTRYFAKPS